MTDYEKHLYMIAFPKNALIASQLKPEDFAKHYTVGTAKHYQSKVIFAELDINFRDPYFAIDDYLAQTVPHEDGSPKKTKFISLYAVLEHVDLQAIQKLYLVTAGGKALGIDPKPYTAINEPGFVRIYQEVTPIYNLVGSNLDQRQFGRWITRETRSKGCPKICFTQIEFDVDEFLRENKDRTIIISPFPEHHPWRLYDCLRQLRADPQMKTKTISLGSLLREISYSKIRHGFWFADGENMLFFPMPTRDELEDKHYKWWREVK